MPAPTNEAAIRQSLKAAIRRRGGRGVRLGALPRHVEFDRAPDFHVLDALRAAHEVKLEGFLGARVETVGYVAGGGLIGFELNMIHGSPYPQLDCADPASLSARPCLRRMSPKR